MPPLATLLRRAAVDLGWVNTKAQINQPHRAKQDQQHQRGEGGNKQQANGLQTGLVTKTGSRYSHPSCKIRGTGDQETSTYPESHNN
ncbi:uncharacterized protein SPSK_10490 [Sporothrix schenckii 1099-18]|uniref:Uncharacterized protein n=1 Tax=Sporothrix schenckii 1099-18 TaxID=1397361 RepID=A0A0F2MDB8_SPOSC|nr:uncharacterized protein SPSK_10490 [Sporothrix schenckii 1099-18]KJR86131.1 hypothetical protein SPSK_10490 [Sporothrix schenckii 1099-18]